MSYWSLFCRMKGYSTVHPFIKQNYIMNTIAFIALSFGLFSTALPEQKPLPIATTLTAPSQICTDVEGYFKRMLATGSKSSIEGTLRGRGSAVAGIEDTARETGSAAMAGPERLTGTQPASS